MPIKNAPAQPLTVTDETLGGAIWTFLRYIVTGLGGMFVSKGYITADTLETILGLLAVAVPNLIGVILHIRNKRRLITVAQAAPDAIAKVR